MRPASRVLFVLLALVAALGWFVAQDPIVSLDAAAPPSSAQGSVEASGGVRIGRMGQELVEELAERARELPERTFGPLDSVDSAAFARVVARFVDEHGVPLGGQSIRGSAALSSSSGSFAWDARFYDELDENGGFGTNGWTSCRELGGSWKPGHLFRFETLEEEASVKRMAIVPAGPWLADPQRANGCVVNLGTVVLRQVRAEDCVSGFVQDTFGTPAEGTRVSILRAGEWRNGEQVSRDGEFLVHWLDEDEELELRVDHESGLRQERRVRRGQRGVAVVLPLDLRKASFTVQVVLGESFSLQDLDLRLHARAGFVGKSFDILDGSRFCWAELPARQEYRAAVHFRGEHVATTDWFELAPGSNTLAPAIELGALVRSMQLRVVDPSGAPIAGAQLVDGSSGLTRTTDFRGAANVVLFGAAPSLHVAALGFSATTIGSEQVGDVVLEPAPLTRIAVPPIEPGSSGSVEAWLQFDLPQPQEATRAARTVTLKVELAVGATSEVALPFAGEGRVTQLGCKGRAHSLTRQFEPIPLHRVGDRLEFDWPVELLAETFQAFVPR
jgi:hypothetical protein